MGEAHQNGVEQQPCDEMPFFTWNQISMYSLNVIGWSNETSGCYRVRCRIPKRRFLGQKQTFGKTYVTPFDNLQTTNDINVIYYSPWYRFSSICHFEWFCSFWNRFKLLLSLVTWLSFTVWNWRWTNFCWKIRNCMACYVSSFQWSPAFGMGHGSWIQYARIVQNRIHSSRPINYFCSN